MFSMPAVPIMIVLLAAFVAAITDIWKFKVYNALTVPLLVSGLLYHGFQGELTDSLVGICSGSPR